MESGSKGIIATLIGLTLLYMTALIGLYNTNQNVNDEIPYIKEYLAEKYPDKDIQIRIDIRELSSRDKQVARYGIDSDGVAFNIYQMPEYLSDSIILYHYEDNYKEKLNEIKLKEETGNEK